eukprot:COSAG05_NODE_738_length_7631_cov_2086.673128_3_plen_171_part_00
MGIIGVEGKVGVLTHPADHHPPTGRNFQPFPQFSRSLARHLLSLQPYESSQSDASTQTAPHTRASIYTMEMLDRASGDLTQTLHPTPSQPTAEIKPSHGRCGGRLKFLREIVEVTLIVVAAIGIHEVTRPSPHRWHSWRCKLKADKKILLFSFILIYLSILIYLAVSVRI